MALLIASLPLRRFLPMVATSLLLVSALARSASPAQDLATLSLEQLANVAITSVSGHQEPLSEAAASIFVITHDDIRRSGARTLPEALRLAPNLEVARVSASAYAISARGMNSADNKLLVLVDGRILYTPLYSGVLWYAQDVMLEDVERIEVISGPGSTVWGSNAVNGVINVITRPAAATRGGLVALGSGSLDREVAARYGGELDGGAFRIYAKTLDERTTLRDSGASANDGRDRVQGGFRADWDSGLTLQGNAYNGHIDQLNRDRTRIAGSNLMSDWTGRLGGAGSLHLHAYFDHSELDVPGARGAQSFGERLDIVDVGFAHQLGQWSRQRIDWGAGYRSAADHLVNSPMLAFLPDERNLHWANVFVQDVMHLSPGVDMTAGVRLEHNTYTGLETMPSLRLAWQPSDLELVWLAVSRAVRTPARVDRDLYSPSTPPFIIAGGPDFRSETADVLEIGYRGHPSDRISYSATAFAHRYRHLRSVELIDGRFYEVANQMEGTTTGIEAWATWQVLRHWRVTAGGVYLHQQLRLRPDSTDPVGIAAAGNDPRVQWQLRSSWDLPHDIEADLSLRHVAALPDPRVPAYDALDLRLAWQVRPGLEFSVVGENLVDPEHVEFGPLDTASVIPRSIFFKLLWTL